MSNRRNIGGETSFAIAGIKVEPFAYWRCAHDWAFGVQLGKLGLRVSNEGRSSGRLGWLVDVRVLIDGGAS